MTSTMHIEHVSVGALRPYARNARTHSKKQVKQIATSIERFGFTNPVLVSDEGEIIAGHGRVEAAIAPSRNPPGRRAPCRRVGRAFKSFPLFWPRRAPVSFPSSSPTSGAAIRPPRTPRSQASITVAVYF